jgi:hypothetical protein
VAIRRRKELPLLLSTEKQEKFTSVGVIKKAALPIFYYIWSTTNKIGDRQVENICQLVPKLVVFLENRIGKRFVWVA